VPREKSTVFGDLAQAVVLRRAFVAARCAAFELRRIDAAATICDIFSAPSTINASLKYKLFYCLFHSFLTAVFRLSTRF